MHILGIDIGTTSICAVALDSENRRTLRTLSAEGPGFLSGSPYERMQDPLRIWEQVREMVRELEAALPLSAIGLTGQMHGILYLDQEGEPLSPLYTWQDGSGAREYSGGLSYAGYLSRKTGFPVRPGYGAATYFSHLAEGRVPPGACCLSTIHSWVAMKLCGRTRPLLHASDGAGLGLFSLPKGDFERQAIRSCGMDPAFFPDIPRSPLCGYYAGKIPVAVAIGDNQASFLGSVREPECSLLVNIGTGSQISFCLPSPRALPVGELRPSADGRFLAVGSSLCGGRAYALLEGFFRQALNMAGIAAPGPLYEQMEAAARRAQAPFPQFSTLFCGTREEPERRAAIQALEENNFTPGHLIHAALQGIAGELFELYQAMDDGSFTARQIIGSGNGFRKNRLLQQILEETFRLPVRAAPCREEAATGAALFALRSAAFPHS